MLRNAKFTEFECLNEGVNSTKQHFLKNHEFSEKSTESLKTAQSQLDQTLYVLKKKRVVIFLKRIDVEPQLLGLL